MFSCIKIVLTSDKSNEVRRAGVQVFALLFRGLETKLCEVSSFHGPGWVFVAIYVKLSEYVFPEMNRPGILDCLKKIEI